MRPVRGVLRQYDPDDGSSLEFWMNPEEMRWRGYNPNWIENQRPHGDVALEWGGRELQSLEFQLLFDGFSSGAWEQNQVQNDIDLLRRWAGQTGQPEPPPALVLEYGHTPITRWIMGSCEIDPRGEIWSPELRRIRAWVNIELVEYRPPRVIQSPAEARQ